jgi:hypothetical protein
LCDGIDLQPMVFAEEVLEGSAFDVLDDDPRPAADGEPVVDREDPRCFSRAAALASRSRVRGLSLQGLLE